MKRIVILAVFGATLLAACSSSNAVVNLDAQAFSRVAAAATSHVLDVRHPEEFTAGHLANAQNIDVEASTFTSEIAKLDKNATYAVYCHSGRRSGIATEQMAKAGFTHLYNLNGGIAAWSAAGGAVVKN